MPAICAISCGPRAAGVDGEAGLDLDRLARALVVQARAGDGVALPAELDAAVVGEDAGAARGGAVGEAPHELPHVDRRVGDGERPLDARVEHRLAAQGLGDVDLLRRQPGLGAAREELVAVRGVVVGRRDEQPAGVLDRRGGDAADDRVLLHALARRDRVLHDVAPAGVQEAVEAAARALGEVGAVDEDDVVAAQCGVPGDPGAGAAATDDEHLGLQRGHAASSLARRGGAPERATPSGACSLLVLEPVEGPRHGLLPVLEVLVARAGVHLGLPALVLLPVLAQVLLLGPEPGREARGVRGAQRRGLRDDRAG